MNVLPMEKQIQVVSALVEGNSVRATARMVGIEHKTVLRILLRVGDRCEEILDERMRNLPCRLVQADEIWTFVDGVAPPCGACCLASSPEGGGAGSSNFRDSDGSNSLPRLL